MGKYNGHDIYGENLLRGHCEVHPHIAHNYPCPSCRNEDDEKQAQLDAYKQYCIEQQEQYDQEMRRNKP
jgi:hypothetical protein